VEQRKCPSGACPSLCLSQWFIGFLDYPKKVTCSLSFVRDFLRRYRETKEIAARPQGGDRRSKIKGENEELVKTIIKKQNDIYLREIKDNLEESNGLKVSVSALSRTVKRLELGRKKKL
jgi:transposase